MMPPTAVRWLIESGATSEQLHRAWAAGTLADVPIGHLWDVVRITAQLGHAALRRVTQAGAELGPVLETPARDTVEVIVPPGTAQVWPPLRGTCAVSAGLLRCPPPRPTTAGGPHQIGSRRWIVPPLWPPRTTDADALCEAVAAALLRRVTAIRHTPDTAGQEGRR